MPRTVCHRCTALAAAALLLAACFLLATPATAQQPMQFVAGVGGPGQPLFDPPPLPGTSDKFSSPPAETLLPMVPPPAPFEMAPPHTCEATSSVWLVSTRQRHDCEYCPVVSRFCNRHGWTRSSLDEFYANDDPSVVTVVFVHGNDNTEQFAIDQGMELYRTMRAAAACQHSVRYVIWSWPSQQVVRPYTRDVKYKATLTDPEAGQLAPFVAGIRPDVPVSLIGYSYGARIVTGALHLLAGGSLSGCGPEAPEQPCQRVPLRAALIAAAMETNWLLPGDHHGRAWELVDCMWISLNREDAALKFFPWLVDRGNGAPALGYRGLAEGPGHELVRDRLQVMNVAGHLGLRHRFKFYLASPPIMRSLCQTVIIDRAP